MTKNNDTPSNSSSARLAAYRSRLKAENVSRVEILLPEPVCSAAQDIAKSHGARYLETVSALAQLGLEAYSSTVAAAKAPGMEPAAFSNVAVSALSVGFSPTTQSLANNVSTGRTLGCIASPEPLSNDISPLARFLKARKEGKHE